jgi:hypothetical protein
MIKSLLLLCFCYCWSIQVGAQNQDLADSLDGRIILNESTESNSEVNLDVSSFPNGTYILNLRGKHYNQSKLIPIFR